MRTQANGRSIVPVPLVITENGNKADYVFKYPYYGEFGELAFYKVRYAFRDPEAAGRPKTFRYAPRKTDGDKLIYRLPELLEAIRGGEPRVLIVEGEKDADTAAEYGHIATTAHQGGGPGNKVTAAQARWFQGYGGQVFIVADRDSTGYATAWRWRELMLAEAGLGESQVVLVSARIGKDLTDHLRAGRIVSGLKRLTPDQVREKAASYTTSTGTREGYGRFLRPRQPVPSVRPLRPISRRWLDMP